MKNQCYRTGCARLGTWAPQFWAPPDVPNAEQYPQTSIIVGIRLCLAHVAEITPAEFLGPDEDGRPRAMGQMWLDQLRAQGVAPVNLRAATMKRIATADPDFQRIERAGRKKPQ